MKKISLLLLIGALSIVSCKKETSNKTIAPAPTQMQKVIAVHDEVMPKMSTINSLVVQLKKVPDSLQNEEYTAAIKKLETSHESMMDWMRGFSSRFDSDEIIKGKALSEEKQQWLDEEEVKVEALKKLINESIEKAESLLKN
ncbi:hypothetical protein GTQ40_16140 [Flavobacteriaceae bacterium R38]|nr:hypothetical protein [Flavobacteriaceae bacterium R38]